MESNDAARELLREADRAEAAPWVDFPPTPRWYPPLVGLWGAGLMLVIGALDGLAQAAGAIGLAVVVGVFAAWYRSYRGAMPKGPMPEEFRSPARRFIAAEVAVFIGGTLLARHGDPWLAALLVLVVVTPLVTWYERAYAAAARATKARLA